MEADHLRRCDIGRGAAGVNGERPLAFCGVVLSRRQRYDPGIHVVHRVRLDIQVGAVQRRLVAGGGCSRVEARRIRGAVT